MRRPVLACICAWTMVSCVLPAPAAGQSNGRAYVGGLFGVSTLSADGRSDVASSDVRLSLYKPENGIAVNLFGGFHAAEYFTVQASWMWNRNDITLVSAAADPGGGAFYEQRRQSRQHAVVLDGLVYFRRRDSRLRPYLGTGLSVLHFSSRDVVGAVVQGLVPPVGEIASSRIGLRSHVGIDVRLSPRLGFRYSFSETISANPISPSLTPPAQRRLANFQNLFGLRYRL